MASPRKDEWVKLVPPDEFSLDNPANTSNGRRNRLVRLDKDSSDFAEGARSPLFSASVKEGRRMLPI